jgi:hypothetical protein
LLPCWGIGDILEFGLAGVLQDDWPCDHVRLRYGMGLNRWRG